MYAYFPYSTLRATRCVKSPTVRVEKMLLDKFLFLFKKGDRKRDKMSKLCLLKTPYCILVGPFKTQRKSSRKQKAVPCFHLEDFSQFWEVAQIEKHFRGETANPVIGQVPKRIKSWETVFRWIIQYYNFLIFDITQRDKDFKRIQQQNNMSMFVSYIMHARPLRLNSSESCVNNHYRVHSSIQNPGISVLTFFNLFSSCNHYWHTHALHTHTLICICSGLVCERLSTVASVAPCPRSL